MSDFPKTGAQPLVSVVIPVYNVEEYLDETLRSVADQTYTHWVAVMVDDGSIDRSSEIASRWLSDPRFRLIQQENAGVSNARNRGVQESPLDAEYIAFLDGDDTWEPEALAVLVEAAERQPAFVGAHARSRYVDQDGVPLTQNALAIPRRRISGRKRVLSKADEPTNFDVLAFMLPINIGNVIVKRTAFDRANGFDPKMAYSEDYDLWLRLSLIGPFAYRDVIILHYRVRSGSAMDRIRLSRRAMIDQDYYVREKLIESPDLNVSQHETALRSQPSWFLVRYAANQFRSGRMLDGFRSLSKVPAAAGGALLSRLEKVNKV